MAKLHYKNKAQTSAYECPWPLKEAILIRVWEMVWTLFVRWLPKPFSRWHILLLKLFGCKIYGRPFIAPSARIYAPWLLEIRHKACLAPRCEVYNPGPVKIEERAVIAQYVYICNGTHDFSVESRPLLVGNITIETDAFVGAKAIVLPGLKVCEGAIVGAGAVVTKDVEPWTVVGGNPARVIKKREICK